MLWDAHHLYVHTGMQQERLHTNAWKHCLLSLLSFLNITWYGLNLNTFSQAHIWTIGLTLWHYLYHSFWQDDELKQPEHSTTMNSSGFNTASIPPTKKKNFTQPLEYKQYWEGICQAMNASLNEFAFWYVRAGIVFSWHQTEAAFQHCVAEMLC